MLASPFHSSFWIFSFFFIHLLSIRISIMAGRRETSRTQQPTQAAPSYPSQRGQFVLDAEGIDRDVITTDICRYLGNDALVRPGKVVVSRRSRTFKNFHRVYPRTDHWLMLIAGPRDGQVNRRILHHRIPESHKCNFTLPSTEHPDWFHSYNSTWYTTSRLTLHNGRPSQLRD